MLAFLVYERTVTLDGEPYSVETSFNLYNFACFNGFNRGPNSFAYCGTLADTLVVSRWPGIEVFNGKSRARAYTSRNNGKDVGEWSLLGMGWATSNLFNRASRNSTRPSPGAMRALDRNTVMQHDTPSGLTSNEMKIRDIIQRMMRKYDDNTRAIKNSSALVWALSEGRLVSCVQFVGSERPSAQAVAFLQTYRNAVSYLGNQHRSRVLLRVIGTIAKATEDTVIPYVDYLLRSGADSCIIHQAGPQYLAACARLGFWNTAHMYRNSSPMHREGSYVKGGQAAHLRHTATEELAGLRTDALESAVCAFGTVIESVNSAMEYLEYLVGAGEVITRSNPLGPLSSLETSGLSQRSFLTLRTNLYNQIQHLKNSLLPTEVRPVQAAQVVPQTLAAEAVAPEILVAGEAVPNEHN